MSVKLAKRRSRWLKIFLITLAAAIVLAVGATAVVRYIYVQNLKQLNANQRRVTVNIPLGSSLGQVAKILKDHGIIKSEWAFKQYVRGEGLDNAIKAGTYALQPSQTVQQIVGDITQSKNLTDLITILPGQRIDQIRKALIDNGFKESSVDKALKPSSYVGHPALVDLPSNKKTLEGYLYPESFQKTQATKPEDIIRQSLDEMSRNLSAKVRDGMVKQGLTVYQGITLASIIEQEVSNASDKQKVAQVFISRLKKKIALGSDPTSPYGAILDGKPPSTGYDSAYNTYIHKGLPPTPISNVSADSLKAVANPAKTKWLYFVAGDDGKTYFSKTLEEHNKLVKLHCKQLCSSQ